MTPKLKKTLIYIAPLVFTFLVFLIIQQLILRSGELIKQNKAPNQSILEL